MTFASLQSVPRQPAQASSPNSASGYGSCPNPCARPPISSASKFVTQQFESAFIPPFGQLIDRLEIIPSYSAPPATTGCPTPYSLVSDHHPCPPSSELSSQSMEAAQSMSTLPQLRHFQHPTGCPSPIASTFDTPNRRQAAPLSRATSKVMPPPYSMPSPTKDTEYDAPVERSAKRVRLSPRDDLHQIHDSNRLHRTSSHSPDDVDELPRPPFQPLTPSLVSSRMSNPMTPASSSTNSDEVRQTWRPASNSYTMQDRHVRRVSVSSLLLNSPEMQHTRTMAGNPAQVYADHTALSPFLENGSPSRPRAHSNTQVESYGFDHGQPDLDVPKNNDPAAINGVSPSQHSELDTWLENVEPRVPEFGFGLQKREFVFAKGGYYASPVPIMISRNLAPLPPILLDNPMNLLYFHHFLNHTARILVVHDCSQNPFRTILPQSELCRCSNEFKAG